ncbi:hypothetical protein KY333_01950 [Candidatus Woesearchaeota archaeon]|nr:hypothetical protein [Candidatus Woesearchaeota archaeon]MBW2994291.1 hypothetical protein [Candidatus Woesearchaeota archaeon]
MGAISWNEYKDRIKRYCWFNKTETRDFILIVLFFAFVLSFDKWGIGKFDAADGIKNFSISLIIVFLSVFLHHIVQRLGAIYCGYKPEQKIWWFGILISVLFLIFSNGRIPVFAGSFLMIHMLTGQRIGKHRYGPSLRTFGYIAMLGPLANLLFAGVLKMINSGIGSPFLDLMIGFNLLYAIYNAIPFPPLDGSRMIFSSRLAYFFFAGLMLGFILLIYVLGLSLLVSLIIAFLLGVICWIVFFLMFERHWT